MAKGYFSYIRVSTLRQGQNGTSLEEQRAAIHSYAKRWRLHVVQEFEEKETAAKLGRPIFQEMLRALKSGRAAGVIIHKIDRSARNLSDWARLGEVIDCGIEVHFANENLDLESRGGRLSADIQAVVAADYIRNLREEVKKGFYGRLKQGFYPMPAPIGYLDQGPAKPKKPDPIMAPRVRTAFELYASECFSISDLVDEMYSRGLRTRTGKKVTKNSLAHLLHNPFYTGLIKISVNEELFVGQHKAIVPKWLFDQVQSILQGKSQKQIRRHDDFIFRRLIHCAYCTTTLIAERQKGSIYYRCQQRACKQKTIRQDSIETALASILKTIRFNDDENRYLRQEIGRHFGDQVKTQVENRQALALQREQLKSRLSNLTDAYVEGVIDKEIYIEKKNRVMLDEQALKDQLAEISTDYDLTLSRVEKILELANAAYLSYEKGMINEKREMVQLLTSNFSVKGKSVFIKLKFPFEMIANRPAVPNGGPQRDTPRTLSRLLSQLLKYFASRKDQDALDEIYKPVSITPRRLKLAFRRANGVDQERLAA